jgi:hypothetical protein
VTRRPYRGVRTSTGWYLVLLAACCVLWDGDWVVNGTFNAACIAFPLAFLLMLSTVLRPQPPDVPAPDEH